MKDISFGIDSNRACKAIDFFKFRKCFLKSSFKARTVTDSCNNLAGCSVAYNVFSHTRTTNGAKRVCVISSYSCISALHGSGVGLLLKSVKQAYGSALAKIPTPQLTRVLEEAVADHPPPLVNGRRIKYRYAHLGGKNPPRIIIHGNQTDATPHSYRRYLENYFRTALKLQGTPVMIEFKTSDNPFRERKNKLSERQLEKRQRLVRRQKKK